MKSLISFLALFIFLFSIVSAQEKVPQTKGKPTPQDELDTFWESSYKKFIEIESLMLSLDSSSFAHAKQKQDRWMAIVKEQQAALMEIKISLSNKAGSKSPGKDKSNILQRLAGIEKFWDSMENPHLLEAFLIKEEIGIYLFWMERATSKALAAMDWYRGEFNSLSEQYGSIQLHVAAFAGPKTIEEDLRVSLPNTIGKAKLLLHCVKSERKQINDMIHMINEKFAEKWSKYKTAFDEWKPPIPGLENKGTQWKSHVQSMLDRNARAWKKWYEIVEPFQKDKLRGETKYLKDVPLDQIIPNLLEMRKKFQELYEKLNPKRHH